MRRLGTAAVAVVLILAMSAGASAQPPTAPAIEAPPPRDATPPTPPTYTLTLQTRHACVTPRAQKLARAEGGTIDVTLAAQNTISAILTGTVAANSYLGCTGTATETFQLIQDFEVNCSDPDVQTVALTLETSLAGFVRSKGRAGACMRRAEVSVTSAAQPGIPMAQSYPVLSVEGTGGQLCNQHLPPLEARNMPLGKYILVATFVLDARGSGVCDAHAVADFSPDTSLPADWVRTRDPFQGVSKKSFGFTASLTATAPPPPVDSSTAGLHRDGPSPTSESSLASGGLADGRRRTPTP